MLGIYAAETSHLVCSRTVAILPSIKQYIYTLPSICVGCSKCACFFLWKSLTALNKEEISEIPQKFSAANS